MSMSDLETAATWLLVIGLLVAICGGRHRALAISATVLCCASIASIVTYIAWLRFGAPMSNTSACYGSIVIDCGFGKHNQFNLGNALSLLGFFVLLNTSIMVAVWALRSTSRNTARV